MNDLIKILVPYKGIAFSSLKEEQKMCVEFANSIRQLTLEGKFPYIWYHIPNEFIPPSRVNYSFDLKQKHMGKISGTPDYCFVGKTDSFFIEFKASKGKQTESQRIFQKWCQDKEINYFLCRSFQDAMKVISNRLCPLNSGISTSD